MHIKPHRLTINLAILMVFSITVVVWASPLLLPAGITLVADINPGSGSSSPSFMTVFNNSLLFKATNPNYGSELWKFNNSIASLAADIYPGTGSSGPQELIVYNNALYFRASDSTYGAELWKYSNNVATRVSDINPGSADSFPQDLVVYNGVLYFSARDGGVYGRELWKYDGTTISLAADVYPEPDPDPDPDIVNSSDPSWLEVFNGKLYFSAYDQDHGAELWMYDSTTGMASLAKDIEPGPDSSTPYWLTSYNSNLYFVCNARDADSSDHGTELWKYDGINAIRLSDINPGSGNASPEGLTGFNNELIFAANDGTRGKELWKYDGTNVSLIRDINVGAGSSSPFYFTEYLGGLYFRADDVSHGYELWKYDGTSASLAVDIITGSLAGYPRYLTVFGDSLYFSGYDGAGHGEELLKYHLDLTAPIVTVSNPPNGSTIRPTNTILIRFNEDMTHDGGISAVNNTANYLLVESKGDGFQTTACNSVDLINDTRVNINSASYNNYSGAGPFEVTLAINDGIPLPFGEYKLFVCGTTSVTDLAGNKINGGEDAIVSFFVASIAALPQTGFAPGVVTILPPQTAEKGYKDLGSIRLRIPSLEIDAPIVGVPRYKDGWDITWLGGMVGWLEDTAFPTWAGNSVLTAHEVDSNGKPGLFFNLSHLTYGDELMIEAWGQKYIYQVRSVKISVKPTDLSALKHQDYPYLTLITCQGYDATNNTYKYRVIVQAVQVLVK